MNRDAPWQAECEIDVELARRLIDELCPQLAPADLEPAGQGWDNTVFRVNRRWVFRFPRRQIGADLLDAEVAIPACSTAICMPATCCLMNDAT